MNLIRWAGLSLAVGLGVALSVRADDPPRSGATPANTVRGRIVEIRPEQRQLTVKPRKGDAVKLTVDDRTRINLGQGGGKLDQLKEGTRIRATYETKDGVHRAVLLQDPLITAERVQGAVNAALGQARAFEFRQRDEYRRKLDAVARDLDARIEELEERAQDVGAQARQQYEKEIQDLQQKREALRARAARVESATAETWSDIQSGVNAAIDDVQRAIERARSRFDAAPRERH